MSMAVVDDNWLLTFRRLLPRSCHARCVEPRERPTLQRTDELLTRRILNHEFERMA